MNTERAMSNNPKYWFSILIGFLVVLLVYKNSSRFFETFLSDANTLSDIMTPPITPDQTTGNVLTTSSGTSRTGLTNPQPSSRAQTSNPQPSGQAQSSNPQPSTQPQVSNPQPSANGQPSGPQPTTFLTLPYPDKLLMYFNSFNIINDPNVPHKNTTYQCQNNYWCDTKPSGIKYFLNGQNVPAKIENIGLPLKNIMIQGPATYSLVNASDNYQLHSFTVIFYLNFNTLIFDTDAEIILYEMFAESPNRIRISITQIPNDTTNVEVNVIVGPATVIYSWTIPITTLLSNGNTTLYSLVYDEDQLLLTLYIGVGKNVYTSSMDKKPDIILGVTPLQINTNRNLDAFISAFCYYNYALSRTDMIAVNNFFIQESSSIYILQSTLSSLKSSLSSQNNALINQLNTTSQTINGLQNTIHTLENKSCPAPQVVAAPAPSGPKWHINMDNVSSVNDKDLQQCSPLTLKEFNIEMPTLPIPNIQATANIVNNALSQAQQKSSTSQPSAQVRPQSGPQPSSQLIPQSTTQSGSQSGPQPGTQYGGIQSGPQPTFYGTYLSQAQLQQSRTSG